MTRAVLKLSRDAAKAPKAARASVRPLTPDQRRRAALERIAAAKQPAAIAEADAAEPSATQRTPDAAAKPRPRPDANAYKRGGERREDSRGAGTRDERTARKPDYRGQDRRPPRRDGDATAFSGTGGDAAKRRVDYAKRDGTQSEATRGAAGSRNERTRGEGGSRTEGARGGRGARVEGTRGARTSRVEGASGAGTSRTEGTRGREASRVEGARGGASRGDARNTGFSRSDGARGAAPADARRTFARGEATRDTARNDGRRRFDREGAKAPDGERTARRPSGDAAHARPRKEFPRAAPTTRSDARTAAAEQPVPVAHTKPESVAQAAAPASITSELPRLSKIMSERGLCSRREADEWIEQGWVKVDGNVADKLGTRIAPDAVIDIDPAAKRHQGQSVTILLHKPIGYVSGQAEDGYEPAVTLVREETRWEEDQERLKFSRAHLRGLAPAGRLDIDSTGLIVFTQDGRIARKLIGQDTSVEKEYLVRVIGTLSADQLRLLNHGLSLDGIALKPAHVSWQNEDQLRFVLREGRKRQIRRMCQMIGLKVTGLKRVRIGSVVLAKLPVGQWRYLRTDERF